MRPPALALLVTLIGLTAVADEGLVPGGVLPPLVAAPHTPEAKALQRRAEQRRAGARPEVARALERFYAARAWAPAWFEAGGAPRPQVQAFLAALAGAEAEGLSAEAYGRAHLERRLREVRTGVERPGRWLELELDLSTAFLTYAAHLLSGHAPPRTYGWRTQPREADLAALLQRALLSPQLGADLAALAPPHEGYRRLREALAQHRRLAAAGGWPLVPSGPTLAPGATHERVRVLRARLRATGELATPPGPPEAEAHFDAPLAEALKAFQRRHGLQPHGRLERVTLAALRVPVEARIRQLQVNLERWRWMPGELPARHLWVNIPAYELRVVEAGRAVLQQRVVTGNPEWQTPVLSDHIVRVEVHPAWAVPRRIAEEEVLPKLREAPDAAARMGLQVLRREDGSAVEAAQVDWEEGEGTGGAGGFRFHQKPGPGNPLGRLKFVMPNRQSIYLHDTPGRRAFKHAERALSHGCVRVEAPEALALFVLAGVEGWDEARLREALSVRRTRGIKLATPLPVYLLYFTAFVADDGQVHFRRDVYGFDRPLARALRLVPPPAARPARLPVATSGESAGAAGGGR